MMLSSKMPKISFDDIILLSIQLFGMHKFIWPGQNLRDFGAEHKFVSQVIIIFRDLHLYRDFRSFIHSDSLHFSTSGSNYSSNTRIC